MFPINHRYHLICDKEPTTAPLFIVSQGNHMRTFTQYGDAEANAKRHDLENNPVIILEVKVVKKMELKPKKGRKSS